MTKSLNNLPPKLMLAEAYIIPQQYKGMNMSMGLSEGTIFPEMTKKWESRIKGNKIKY